VDIQIVAPAVLGTAGGLLLLIRGFGGYRMAARLGDTSASRIGSAAVGEVLISGSVEPAELTLVSPLQSAACVYYRSRIDESDGDDSSTAFREERAVGFTVRDDSGEIRVFPRGASFDVPVRFDERTGTFGEEPAGLRLRSGPAFGAGGDREAQIAALLSVRPAAGGIPDGGGGDALSWTVLSASHLRTSDRRRRYSEARIEPGDVVTILGRAVPFDQLPDPGGADILEAGNLPPTDPEVTADVAAARAAGTLLADPEDAWGNAAIPGFGIGRPVRQPELDDGATDPALAAPEDAARFERTFEIAPDALVLATSPDVLLVISLGPPSVAVERQRRQFVLGLLGAVLAIGSAMALALAISGGIGG
jgi:hypothetical protein